MKSYLKTQFGEFLDILNQILLNSISYIETFRIRCETRRKFLNDCFLEFIMLSWAESKFLLIYFHRHFLHFFL